ncbi:cache domain-containing protein, partial [Helicobacter sp. MIT 21-1697]|uniref:cache domain-containing protein n=1 Tax=Helicobacter sp. MIT 21-1697 TaxID=2993733 RepID=UPI00224ACA49
MNLFSRLNIGAKVAFAIALLVIVCVCVLATCIILTSKNTLEEESYRILHQASYRYGTLLESVASEILDALSINATIINAQMERKVVNIEDLRDIIVGIPNNVDNIKYAYLYTTLADKGEVILLAEENGERGKKAHLIKAEDSIKNFESIQDAITNNKPSLSSATSITFQNKEYFVQGFAVPIHNKNGEVIGALGCFVDFGTLGAPLLSDEARVFTNDQRFVIDESGVILVNQNPQFIGKKLVDIVPTQEAKNIAMAAKEGKNGIFPYRTAAGLEGVIGMHSVAPLKEGGKYWSALSYIPSKSITQSLIKLLWVIIMCSIATILIIVIGTILYLRISVAKRIQSILRTLTSFFSFLNHE